MSASNRRPPGFNAAFLPQHRPERLLAFHLQRLGIQRLLDIGANTGQFVQRMRSLGYRGFIHSLEPQAAAHAKLLANARADARWFPLPRQGAGAEKGFFDLNLSENSESSSLLEVHQNHIRAESATRTVGTERIFVSRTSELLRPEYMACFEALKIDVQGFEDKVIDGYLPCMPHVRMLMLELSMVECYHGAPDLFALDALLVNRLGFSRIAFEPSYYDDKSGVVQQYDGLYCKPGTTGATIAAGATLGAVVTSIAGTLERRSADSTDVGAGWLALCARSWLDLAPRAISVSPRAPAIAGLQWIETPAQPSLAQLFRAMEEVTDRHVLLTSPDIAFTQEMKRLVAEADPMAIYYGDRLEVEMHPGKPDTLTNKGLHRRSFDYFLLPPAFVRLVNREALLPEAFRPGEPWTDYLLPVIALARGFPVKRLELRAPLALHHAHEAGHARALRVENGRMLLQCVARLLEDPACYGEGPLREILAAGAAADIEQGLDSVARVICDALP